MFGLSSILSFLAGAAVGVGGKMAYDHWRAPSSGGAPVVGARLHGTIVPGPAGAPSLGSPQAGYATEPLYEWGYRVGAGDSAGGIAEAITGHDVRYQELLLANPDLATIGEAGVYAGDHAWDFAPGAFQEGTQVLLPLAWNPYIDQTGVPRGRAVPFPNDPRKFTMTSPPPAALPVPAPTPLSLPADGLATGSGSAAGGAAAPAPALAPTATKSASTLTAGVDPPYRGAFLQALRGEAA
jgi:hypothetical protein